MDVTDSTPALWESAAAFKGECDRCGARAVVAVQIGSRKIDIILVQVVFQQIGAELLFCGHHWRENFGRLREMQQVLGTAMVRQL